MKESNYTTNNGCWTFGFGTNMSVANVERIKKHKVFDHFAGVVNGYRLCFNYPGLPKIEPAFANAVESTKDDSIHGVAIMISERDMEKLDAQEDGYSSVRVTVNGYNGRVVENCLMYIKRNNLLPPEKQHPSLRYLKLVINGAVEAGLSEIYIEQLKSIKPYVADIQTISRRNTLPLPKSLPSFSLDQLFSMGRGEGTSNENNDELKLYVYVAVLGYILRLPYGMCEFSSHISRDITFRCLQHCRGELPLSRGLQYDIDTGKPPFPDVSLLTKYEKEYVFCWLDYYLDRSDVVGYLKEFLDENDVTKM